MSSPAFLIDENLPPLLATQLQRLEPEIKALAVGQPNAPPKGTLDPDILKWMEVQNVYLVTNNRASMPVHLIDNIASGGHVPGIFVTPTPLNIGLVLQELLVIWAASTPDEHQDRIVYLPLG